MIVNNTFADMISSPIRSFRGRVEIFKGSTLTQVCGCHDNLKSFTVERAGEQGKFFGFGICQKLTANLIDRERALDITKEHYLEVEFGVGNEYIYPCPNFYIEEITRDENTNSLTITAYDALYKASTYKVADLDLPQSYTLRHFTALCANLLGVPLRLEDSSVWDLDYEQGANFDGTESIREALNAVAEATQTIYFINRDWELTFIKLAQSAAPALTIGKDKYFTLDSKTNYRLSAIVSATELGDNVGASLDEDGVTQYVRNNPFWELRDDIADLVSNALANIAGLTINQFNCSWRGNFLLEIGDKIELVTKDDSTVTSFVLNDSFSFNGSLSGKLQWNYENKSGESAANPVTLGEAIKQTYARVDKANKEITMLASEVNANATDISQMKITTDSINASVEHIEQITNDNYGEISTLKERVDATVTADAVTIAIQEEMAKGTDKVTTTTGFTFNDDGLTVSKSNSEMTTQITEDGMSIYREGDKVLLADNQGVMAENLIATTYLIINTTSRFEDSEDGKRTCCYWIGG